MFGRWANNRRRSTRASSSRHGWFDRNRSRRIRCSCTPALRWWSPMNRKASSAACRATTRVCLRPQHWCPSRGFSISVNKGGFAPWEAKDIEILVGQNLNYNVVLSVAATSTQLDVSATAQLVETHEDRRLSRSQQRTDHEHADQWPPRGFLRPDGARCRTRRRIWPGEFPRNRGRQRISHRRQRTQLSNSTTKRPGAHASRRRFRRTPCRSSRC